MTYFAVKELITNVGLKKSPFLRQAWAMSSIFLTILSTGILEHQPTPEDLRSKHNVLSPVLAYNSIVTVIGYVASSILMDQVGRRLAFILGTLPGILSCFFVNFPDAARVNTLRMILNGLSTGFTVILGTIIIGEYTSPKYRGVFLNLITTFMNIGRAMGLMLRPNYHWELMITASVLQIMSLGIAITWPESPYWLASKGQNEKSEIAFLWLRDTTCKKELAELTLLRDKKKVSHSLFFKTTVYLLQKYLSSDFLRPVTVVIFGVVLMETSGRYFLATSSLATVQFIGDDYDTYQIYTSVILLTSSLLTLSLIFNLGHRTQLLISGSLVALFLLLRSVYIFLISNNIICDKIPWLGSLLFILQLFFANLGTTSIPLALIGEVFPIDYKAAGSLVSGVIISIASWAVVISTPYLLSSVHLQGVLVIFGTLITISVVVLFVILPETRNKTLLEIEEYFNNECCLEDEISDVVLPIEYYTKAGIIPLLY